MRENVLITTGGSGGHVIPALALFDHYRENFEIILKSTDGKKIEKEAIITNNIKKFYRRDYE